MSKANKEIRTHLNNAGLTQWQVAEEMGISHVTLSVWLRTPLTDEQHERVTEAISRIERGVYA